MKKITDIDIKGMNVLIRVDFNVPIVENKVADSYRIEKAKKTIQYCLDQGACVILMSHLGRPKNIVDKKYSLEPILFVLEEMFDNDIYFSDDCISSNAINFSNELIPGEIHLLENLRFYKQEKNNDVEFARSLSEHADIFINDAFGVCHREHASNSAILNFFDHNTSGFGFLINSEISYLKKILVKPPKPFTLILGGAKIDDKILMIENMLHNTDNILIGGKMAFSFLKAKGENVGGANVDKENITIAKNIIGKAKQKSVKIYLPKDFVCVEKDSNVEVWSIKKLVNLCKYDLGYDIGPETSLLFDQVIVSSKCILWNGPMGRFELHQFATGTDSVANSVGKIKGRNALTVVGGGDTASAVNSKDLKQSFNHISTGGGASLMILSGKKNKIIKEIL